MLNFLILVYFALALLLITVDIAHIYYEKEIYTEEIIKITALITGAALIIYLI